jgi:hypothetical protein
MLQPKPSGYAGHTDPWINLYHYNAGYDCRFINLPFELGKLIDSAISSMLVGELDNNDFELIPFFLDLDATIAMFSVKFLKQLSYGAVNWGVLPFISDVRSLIVSLRDIYRQGIGEFASCSKLSRRRDINFTWPIFESPPYGNVEFREGNLLHAANGVARANGVLTWNPPSDDAFGKALFLLDELGVHPDLKTAWDVIPLSFVVDYFIPIGNLLESLHPRGWGSSGYTFTGFTSVKLTCEIADVYWWHGTQQRLKQSALYKYYARTSHSGLVPVPVTNVEWQAPSLREIFNAAYLTSMLKRLF